MKGIKNSVAFVTGAEKGLGKEIAKSFAENGANVVLFGIDEEAGKETEKELIENGSKALFIKGNVTSSSDLKNAMDKVVESFGTLDFAVNCAGLGIPFNQMHLQSEEEYARIMDVNLKGVFLSMKHELEVMVESNKGKIVNISSAVGTVGVKGLALYTTSKHAVKGLTKAAALDYAETGIRINAVAPGTMATPMVLGLPEGEIAIYKAGHPINDLVEIKPVAENVVWLCSDASNFTTGSVFRVDGGYTAQ